MAGRVASVMIAAALLGVSGTPSLAAASPSCGFIQDTAGDGNDQLNGTRVGPNEPDLDILSADVATDARSVTTVVRVANLGTALQAAGRRNLYRFFFQLGSRHENVVTLATRSLD